jgi:hypothetical protein
MLSRLAGLAACALALTLAAPAAAHAAALSLVDGPGDVWTLAGEPQRVPNHDQGDILRMTFTHSQRQVVVRSTFAELKREGRQLFVFAQLRTNTGQVRELSLTATPRQATNRWRGTVELTTPRGTVVDCAISHRIDYATNVAVVRLARTCLNNPRTVQAKFGVATFAARRAFADNPINHGPTNRLPRYTAPVRRG